MNRPGFVRGLVWAVPLVCLLASIPPAVSAGPSAPVEADRRKPSVPSRAIMDEGVEWALSPQHIERVLQRIQRAGFNVYIPCVWHGAGTRFMSRLAPPEEAIRANLDRGFDPLAYLIRRAHEMNIEVHPWFTVTLRQREFLQEFYGEGTPQQAFDIHRAEFRSFMTQLILEVVRSYEIDGVNLDYVRSMGICQSPACRTSYTRATGHDLMADLRVYRLSPPAWTRIQRWNSSAVDDIVSVVAREARLARPNLVISADGKPHDVPPRLEGRDLIGWANAGVVDVVYYTDYSAEIDVEQFEAVRRQLARPESLGRMIGNYEKQGSTGWSRRADLVAHLMSMTQTSWPKIPLGVYLYKQLDEAQIDALRAGPFSKSGVSRPSFTPTDRPGGRGEE
jgi:uncharacterized lipoprotein YddW (UPF0748 family)